MLDFIGVGLGPFNLSLASLLHEKSDLNYLFFDQKTQFEWHSGMQLPNTMLQVPFMADLVSMVDPTSPLSFLNYLKDQQRLYKFYFLEQAQIARKEYNHYCQWVADQIDRIQYLSTVTEIIPKSYGFEVVVLQDGIQNRYRCRNVVLGTGNIPSVPDCLKSIVQSHPHRCTHSAYYLDRQDQKRFKRNHQNSQCNVVVIGSGQSAAEIFLDLFDQQYEYDQVSKPKFSLNWLTRASGFFPMEYTPLGLEHFSPDYMKHFYQFDDLNKNLQLSQQGFLYKGISAKTIQDIYTKLYHRHILENHQATHLHSQSNLIDAEIIENERIRLVFQDRVTLAQFSIDADDVICATGYKAHEFEFLKQLKPLIECNAQGQWQVSENFCVEYLGAGQIYVQNMSMHSHGIGTPDLGLGAYRAATIANQLLGYALYDLTTEAQCFQHFDPLQNPQVKSAKFQIKANALQEIQMNTSSESHGLQSSHKIMLQSPQNQQQHVKKTQTRQFNIEKSL